jgi:hypothetical protein
MVGAYPSNPVLEGDAANEDEEQDLQVALFLCQEASAVASIVALNISHWENYRTGSNHCERMLGAKAKERQQLDITKYVDEIDCSLFCCKYQMNKSSFYTLLGIIERHMKNDGSS